VSTMNEFQTLLQQPVAQVIGWALLHFLWQGALIGGLTALALAMLRQSAADVRYVVATIGLSLMLTLPAVTAGQLWRAIVPAGPPAVSAVTETTAATARPLATAAASAVEEAPATAGPVTLDPTRLEPWLPALVLGWLCGVALLTLRLISGWLWVQRMKSHGASPADEGWQHIVERLSRRLHIARRVRLFESTLVDVPTVIGWLKPVVLLPASALAGLSPQQLEAILAHELAHIRRHDYLVNLLQTLVETLLFYHPAVWWLSRRIRTERENCCDDLAVSLCGDPYTYAEALADLEELRGAAGPRPFLAMAATGGSLVQRVRRLLGAPSHAGRAPGWLAGSATILVMLGIAAGAASTDAFQTSQPSTQPQAAAAAKALSAEDVAATTRALEATAKALATELKSNWDAVVQGTRRSTPRAVKPRPTREMKAAGSEQQAASTRRASALEDRARALADTARTRPVPALADVDRALAHIDRAANVAITAMVTPALADMNRVLSELDRATAAALTTAALTTESSARSVAAAAVRAAARPAGARQRTMTFSWSNNREKLEVKLNGEIEFTDDDADLKSLSPGGSLRIRNGGWFASHTMQFTADASGKITRRFWVASAERPFEPEGRQWLSQMLPRFIRQTGIGAPARAARIYKSRGAAGVLGEISLIEGSWGKRVYFKELFKMPLDPATARQAVVQAGREIESDFELASLLIDEADKLLADPGTRQAYFDAARTIQSDFEARRVYSSALSRGPVSSPILAGVLEGNRIDSDFEQASLLMQIAKLQPLDGTSRGPFFAALDTVASDFEHRRVLSALADRTDLTAETVAGMLESSIDIESDFEMASFLLDIARRASIDGPLRAPFFRALDTVGSTFERGRVLQAVVRRAGVSEETVLAALRSTKGMGSSFEAGQVLLTLAGTHPLSPAARDAYIDAAEKLGNFEQGKVLSALVRNERRR